MEFLILYGFRNKTCLGNILVTYDILEFLTRGKQNLHFFNTVSGDDLIRTLQSQKYNHKIIGQLRQLRIKFKSRF